MVESHQVEQGGVQVANMNAVLDSAVAEFVRRAISEPSLHPTPGKPDRVTVMIVIAASRLSPTDGNLHTGRASEFTAAENQSFFEQSTLGQVGK